MSGALYILENRLSGTPPFPLVESPLSLGLKAP
jgi:hypothetical protein